MLVVVPLRTGRVVLQQVLRLILATHNLPNIGIHIVKKVTPADFDLFEISLIVQARHRRGLNPPADIGRKLARVDTAPHAAAATRHRTRNVIQRKTLVIHIVARGQYGPPLVGIENIGRHTGRVAVVGTVTGISLPENTVAHPVLGHDINGLDAFAVVETRELRLVALVVKDLNTGNHVGRKRLQRHGRVVGKKLFPVHINLPQRLTMHLDRTVVIGRHPRHLLEQVLARGIGVGLESRRIVLQRIPLNHRHRCLGRHRYRLGHLRLRRQTNRPQVYGLLRLAHYPVVVLITDKRNGQVGVLLTAHHLEIPVEIRQARPLGRIRLRCVDNHISPRNGFSVVTADNTAFDGHLRRGCRRGQHQKGEESDYPFHVPFPSLKICITQVLILWCGRTAAGKRLPAGQRVPPCGLPIYDACEGKSLINCGYFSEENRFLARKIEPKAIFSEINP